MKTIIVSDIFGRTEGLEEIALRMPDSSVIFDPYDAEFMGFQSEPEAYDYFSSNVGVEKYSDTLCQFITSFLEPVQIVAFSVGASAIWKISERPELSHVSGAVCFYGSQIRNDTHITPRFPIQLIFPVSEKHFSVSELITVLKDKEKVIIEQADFYHGFMNKHSPNYDSVGYSQYLQALCSVQSNTLVWSAKEL